MSQSEIKADTCNWRQAREKTCDRGTIGFGLTSYWLRKWREFYQPITARSNAKPKQKRNYFRHSIENRSKLLLLFAYEQDGEREKEDHESKPEKEEAGNADGTAD